jgi:predicted amidohydrolase
MKISLIQLDAGTTENWSCEDIPQLLMASKGCDLAVFPENMPFHSLEKIITIKEAREKLITKSILFPDIAFIAGGYVAGDSGTRNAVFLVYNGAIHGTYFKRIPWDNEPIEPGEKAVLFSWKPGFSCVPLICADAIYNPSRIGTKMMDEVIAIGANVDTDTPIVISSYGADLETDYWQIPLKLWSKGCGAVVAICAVSGKSKSTFEEDGKTRNYGGGGSAMFWTDGSRSSDKNKKSGIYLIDTVTRHWEYREK